MELETELEEGEACFQNNNGDDSMMDPDIALSYIDEKLQDVLGHCQKEFEGGVSAENLGSKFGGYGSFLPTYQRSPVSARSTTPPKVLAYNASISPSNGVRQNSVSQSNATQSARHGPASFSAGSASASRGVSMDGNLEQEVPVLSVECGKKLTSYGQHVNSLANASDQKPLKVRIKVGAGNLLIRRNTEIYSGLGLDVSPSSSLEASPVDSDGFFHVHQDGPDESPTSILEIMTSFPVCESLILSPLPYDLLHLIEKKKWEDGTLLHGSDSGKVNQNVVEEKKPKSFQKNSVLVESINGNDVCGDLAMKETGMDYLAFEELVSNSRLCPPSDTQCNIADFGKGASFNREPNDESSDIAKEEPLDPVFARDDWRVEKPNRNDDLIGKILVTNMNSDEKNPVFSTEMDSDVSKGSRTLDTGLVKPPKQKGAGKATSREKGRKLALGKETWSPGGNKKSKGSQVLENGTQDVDVLKGGLKHDSCSTSKTRNDAYGPKNYVEDLKKNNEKEREAYKDLFGELDLEQEDDDNIALEKPSGDMLEDSAVIEKGTLESNISPTEKERKKSQKPSSSVYPRVGSHTVPTSGNGPLSDAAVATMAPLLNEDWVCCDKCEKWRLLPPGVNPSSLPEKWLCSMLDWLPGMNWCSISEEETTKAITSLFPAPMIQGSQTAHPVRPRLGVISVDALLPDQRHQNFGSQAPSAGVKKKHGSKDLVNETKLDRHRPSLSSTPTKKKLQTSYRSRSLNGANQSPSVNEVEFQDSAGDNTHLAKIRNKREITQDYPGECKKVKTDGKHGTGEDRASHHVEAVLKASCCSSSGLPAGISEKDHRKHNACLKDTKSASKVSARNQENQNQISLNDGTFDMAKYDKKNVAKKRKANKFEDAWVYMEETNETDHNKKKKARALKSREEGICANKDIGGADKRGRNEKDERIRSLDIKDSSKKDTIPAHASLAAASSSSKVSGSHKTKATNLEVNGSPVESVSSSPLRILNPDKFASSKRDIRGVNNCQDASSPKKFPDGDDNRGSYQSETVKKDYPQIATCHQSLDLVESQESDLGLSPGKKGKKEIVPPLEFGICHVAGGGVGTSGQGIQYCNGAETSSRGHNEERMNSNQSHASGSCPKKYGRSSSFRSKDKSQMSRSAIDKVNTKTSEPLNEDVYIPLYEEKLEGVRNKSRGQLYVESCEFGNGSASKEFSGISLIGSAKIYNQPKHRYHDGSDVKIDAISSQDVMQNLPKECDGEQCSKRDASERGNSHSLPPSGRSQNETERLPQPISGSQKDKSGNPLSLDAAGGNDALNAPKQDKKAEDQNANRPMNMRHPTPNRHKGRDHDAPSLLRKDTSSQAAANALKEATDLKHTADRIKNSGSNLDSRALYIQASLKFLYAASLLESCYTESGKYADIIQSMVIYSSTAKLCEYCAHEYEKTKEMAAAALAYKCMEVAYLRVVYSSHASAWKDRHELQTSLQTGPTGESPSSSASDLDNLNNQATANKAALVKDVNPPQVAGNHVIAARNKPNFMRILNFAQDVNLAMEASRKSRTAFKSSSSEGAQSKELMSAVKTALDFNFQDVNELLHLVRVAMEVINR